MKRVLTILVGLSLSLPLLAVGYVGDPTYRPPAQDLSVQEVYQNIIETEFRDGLYDIKLVNSSLQRDGNVDVMTFTYITPAQLFGTIPTSVKRSVIVEVEHDGNVVFKEGTYLFENVITSVQSRFLVDRISASVPTVLANVSDTSEATSAVVVLTQ